MNVSKKKMKQGWLWVIGCLLMMLQAGCATSRSGMNRGNTDFRLHSNDMVAGEAQQADVFGGEYDAILARLENYWAAFAEAHERKDMDAAIPHAAAFSDLGHAVKDHFRDASRRVWLAHRLAVVDRELERARTFARLSPHFETFEYTERYSEAIAAAASIVEILTEASGFGGWTHADRVTLDEAILLWQRQKTETERMFGEHVQQAEGDAVLRQHHFVNTAARRDIDGARRMIQSQERKRFNWKLFGYPRDDARQIALAMQALGRVEREALVDVRLRAEAQILAMDVDDRVSRRSRRMAQATRLPAYQQLSGYPQFTRDSLKAEVDPLRGEGLELWSPEGALLEGIGQSGKAGHAGDSVVVRVR